MSNTLYTHVDVEIARPPLAVWNVITNYATDTSWRKGITAMTPDRPGPPEVGTNVHEVLRLGGREYITDTSITQVGPGLSYSFAGIGTSGVVRGRRSVVTADKPDSAVFSYDVELEPVNIPRPVRPILRRWLQHSLQRDVHRLRNMLERTPTPSAT